MAREESTYLNIIELNNGKILAVKPLDATRLFIDTSNIAFLDIEKNKDDDIVAISFEDRQRLSLGDKIFVRIGTINSQYEVKMIIVEKKNKSVILFSSLPNKTSTFLLPLLDRTKSQLKYDTYFVNAFISEDHKSICLLYRFTGTKLYKEFETLMFQEKYFMKHIDFDPYHVMYMFRIPEQFEDDIEFFLSGQYSKFSVALKTMITRFYGNSTDTVIYQVIHKSQALKEMIERDLNTTLPDDMELASKPILEQEFYKL